MLLRFFMYLLDIPTNLNKGLSNKIEIHTFVFPEKPYSERRLEKCFTKFFQLLEQFLVAKHYQREGNKQQRALDFLGILRAKNLVSLYEYKIQKIKKIVEDRFIESTENYKFRYEIAREEHEWRSLFNTGKGDLAIHESIINLDFFYFAERIELANRLLMQKTIAALDSPSIIQFCSDPSVYYKQYETQSPLLLIRSKIQDMLLQNIPSKQEFESLLNLINLHEKRFPVEYLYELYTHLRNVCTILANSAKSDIVKLEMYEVLHKIQQDNLIKGYLFYQGKLSPPAFLNIIKVALKVQDIQWTKEFLASHGQMMIEGDNSEEHLKFGFALCYFTEKKYDDALQFISFPVNSPILHLEIRRLELKVYYELQSELLFYKIDAFRKFLERTAQKIIPTAHKEYNLNFVKLLLQLALSKPKDTQRSIRLIKRIEEKKKLADIFWLSEKARELAQGK